MPAGCDTTSREATARATVIGFFDAYRARDVERMVELCMVRSLYSDNNNHPQAMRCLLTGKIFPGRPALGAWVSYALGTESQNLPAFVVLRDPDGPGVVSYWDNAQWNKQLGCFEVD